MADGSLTFGNQYMGCWLHDMSALRHIFKLVDGVLAG